MTLALEERLPAVFTAAFNVDFTNGGLTAGFLFVPTDLTGGFLADLANAFLGFASGFSSSGFLIPSSLGRFAGSQSF